MLNDDNTEFLVIGTRQQINKLSPSVLHVMCSIYEINHIGTADADESKERSSQSIFLLKHLERRSLKKNQGFNGIRTRDLRDTGAMRYQQSYEVTHWERGQLAEFISPVRSEMLCSIHEINHIGTAEVDESKE